MWQILSTCLLSYSIPKNIFKKTEKVIPTAV